MSWRNLAGPAPPASSGAPAQGIRISCSDKAPGHQEPPGEQALHLGVWREGADILGGLRVPGGGGAGRGGHTCRVWSVAASLPSCPALRGPFPAFIPGSKELLRDGSGILLRGGSGILLRDGSGILLRDGSGILLRAVGEGKNDQPPKKSQLQTELFKQQHFQIRGRCEDRRNTSISELQREAAREVGDLPWGSGWVSAGAGWRGRCPRVRGSPTAPDVYFPG